jgi:hypothetical protein
VNEEIYVEKTKGFEVPSKEDFVYKLKKALYGLKQAPRTLLGVCYIIFTTRCSVFYVAPDMQGGSAPNNFFSSENVSPFCLVFCIASIFMSIIGRFFDTWFFPMVFYFWLKN